MKLEALSVTRLSELLRTRELSSLELTLAYLENIDRKNAELGAYITVDADRATEAAIESDRRRARGDSLGALDGIPFSLKDNFCTEGIRTTCGSRMLENYIPPYTATAVKRLMDGGTVLLGKTNMDEFGMGSLSKSSAFGCTRNPLDTARTPGGSSGGSAASVAADMAAFSIGSDTGGSVRLPAAYCGLVGIKPTYGRISRYGLVSFAPSLDTVGLLTKTVSDGELLLSAVSGKDTFDATSLSKKPYEPTSISSLSGVKIGIIKELFSDPLPADVRAAVNFAADQLSKMGAEIIPISLPSLSLAAECYYVISCCEASSNLARFDGIRYGRRAEDAGSIEELYVRSRTEGLGNEVKRRIMLGTFALSEGSYDKYYRNATALRARLSQELDGALSECALLLSPTAPSSARPLNEAPSRSELYAADVYTVLANLSGAPAVSIPYAQAAEALPVGVQLIGRRLDESRLLATAKLLKGEVSW